MVVVDAARPPGLRGGVRQDVLQQRHVEEQSKAGHRRHGVQPPTQQPLHHDVDDGRLMTVVMSLWYQPYCTKHPFVIA